MIKTLMPKVGPAAVLIGDHGNLNRPLNIDRRIIEADAFFRAGGVKLRHLVGDFGVVG